MHSNDCATGIALQWMENGHLGWAGVPVVSPVEVEPDKGHASVQAPPLNTEEGSVKEMMSTLTSATMNHALVSFHLKSNTHSFSLKCKQMQCTSTEQ